MPNLRCRCGQTHNVGDCEVSRPTGTISLREVLHQNQQRLFKYKREKSPSRDYGRYDSVSRTANMTLRQSLPALPAVTDLDRNRRGRAVLGSSFSPLKKSASTLEQNGWRFNKINVDDPGLTKYMTPQQVMAKASKLEHDKAVDHIVRELLYDDHAQEINEFDIRKKTVVWGLQRAQNETLLLQNNERAREASNFKDLSIKKRKPIKAQMFDNVK